MAKIGEQAPDFKLFNSEKKEISLADFKGQNLVILFFPLAFTGVCTIELCTVRDDIANYKNINSAVVGVSVDSVFTLAKFKEEQGLNFDLLSDFNAEAATAYGAKYDSFVMNMKNVARRAAFVIDKAGIVRYAEVLESAGDLPNFLEIKNTLASLN